ncbi:hypothetical protein ACSJL1_003375 [Serratia sarumanii]
MINRYAPEDISDKTLREVTRRYYQTMFSYAIPDRLLDEVLAQR